MKIIDILKPRKSTLNDIIHHLLKKDIKNDKVLESCYFDIVIKNINPLHYLYRKLWEGMYLRRGCTATSKYVSQDDSYIIKISLAEAIEYINMVTPPLFRSRAKEQVVSVDSIHDMLCHYLMDENDQLSYHLSVFEKCMSIRVFETNNTYNTERINILKQYKQSGIIVDVEACSCPFNEIYTGEFNNQHHVHPQVQLMLYCRTSNDIDKAVRMINNDWYVLNIFIDDNHNCFIDCFTYIYYPGINEELQQTIIDTYKPIFKNK